MWQIMVFFLGSLVIVGLSRRVFEDIRSHGFYRFLAFEALWAIITINVTAWFQDAFSVRQVISWLLLFGSLVLAISGFTHLRAAGRSASKRPSASYAFEQSARLVTTGPYRIIRHPLYASLILLAWGSGLKSGSLVSIFFCILATAFLYYTALLEEDENLMRFGEPYAEYMAKTRMFMPGVY